MNVKIRHGVFETNSSSEHTVCIMKNSELSAWKEGKALGRVRYINEDEHSWGNFWSKAYSFEFTGDLEQANKENEILIERERLKDIAAEENWKKQCLDWKPDPEADPEDNEYFAQCYKFDQNRYDNRMRLLNDKKEYAELFPKMHDFMECGLWITFKQFWDDLIVDCWSPFEHTDPKSDIALIGKYFHS